MAEHKTPLSLNSRSANMLMDLVVATDYAYFILSRIASTDSTSPAWVFSTGCISPHASHKKKKVNKFKYVYSKRLLLPHFTE